MVLNAPNWIVMTSPHVTAADTVEFRVDPPIPEQVVPASSLHAMPRPVGQPAPRYKAILVSWDALVTVPQVDTVSVPVVLAVYVYQVSFLTELEQPVVAPWPSTGATTS